MRGAVVFALALATAPAAALRLVAPAGLAASSSAAATRAACGPSLCAESDRTPTLAERDAALQEAIDKKAAQREVTKARVAEKYDDAGAALVTAAQSARFNRRMRGAAQVRLGLGLGPGLGVRISRMRSAAQACPKRPHA